MSTATVTSKGQTTIPQAIRSHLGLHAGDKLEFIIEENGEVVITPLTANIHKLKGMLRSKNVKYRGRSAPSKKISIEDMNRVI